MTTDPNSTEPVQPKPLAIAAILLGPPLIYYFTGVIHPWIALLGLVIVALHGLAVFVFWALVFNKETGDFRGRAVVFAILTTITLWQFRTFSHYGVRDYFRLRLSKAEVQEIFDAYEKQLPVQFEWEFSEGRDLPRKWDNSSNRLMKNHLERTTALNQLAGFDTFAASRYGFAYSIRNKDTYMGILFAFDTKRVQRIDSPLYPVWENAYFFISSSPNPLLK